MDFADEIIERFYFQTPELRRVLLKHSKQVRDKALQLCEDAQLELDLQLVSDGAMLHDIGIIKCHAPDIFCPGELPYIAHGIAGAGMLRALPGDMERLARICERHTGSGLTAEEIVKGGLPLPEKDFLPETLEEKVICLADKFFSKSGEMKEKPLPVIRKQMAKFGFASLARFDELCRIFGCFSEK